MKDLVVVYLDPAEAELAADLLDGAADMFRDLRAAGHLSTSAGARPSFNELGARNVARIIRSQVKLQAQGGGGTRG